MFFILYFGIQQYGAVNAAFWGTGDIPADCNTSVIISLPYIMMIIMTTKFISCDHIKILKILKRFSK